MIPRVDIGCYIRSTSGDGVGDLKAESVKQVARELRSAISQHGFCYLLNHGISQDVVDGMHEISRQFFQLPESVKETCAQSATNGWLAFEREKHNPEAAHRDLKEAYNLTLPGDDAPMPDKELPEMRRRFTQFYEHCRRMSLHVLDLLTLALGYKDVQYFRDRHQLMGQKGSFAAFRSAYYPPPRKPVKEGQLQNSEHSDYGSITLLFMNDISGLQVMGPDGEYHDVPPLEGAVVLNIGDMMQRWTADRFPAKKHRVLVKPDAFKSGRARQSQIFFVQPDNDTVIECLDGSKKYRPVTSYDYLMQKLSVIY